MFLLQTLPMLEEVRPFATAALSRQRRLGKKNRKKIEKKRFILKKGNSKRNQIKEARENLMKSQTERLLDLHLEM